MKIVYVMKEVMKIGNELPFKDGITKELYIKTIHLPNNFLNRQGSNGNKIITDVMANTYNKKIEI